MNARLWAILTVLAGLGILVVNWFGGMLPEAAAAGDCPPQGAIILFELARNKAELAQVFGPAGGACEAPMVALMNAVNRGDLALYIPTYTAFCIFAALYMGGGPEKPLAVAAIVVALVAAAADVVETRTLLAVTGALEAPEALLPRVLAGAWTKFAMLGVHALLLAALAFTSQPRRWILFVLGLLPLPTVALAAFDQHAFHGLLLLGIAPFWTALLVFAARDAIALPSRAVAA